MEDMTSAVSTRSAETDLGESRDALYLRTAKALERSAALAEDHAERLRRSGKERLAELELDSAERARRAAERARALVSRLR